MRSTLFHALDDQSVGDRTTDRDHMGVQPGRQIVIYGGGKKKEATTNPHDLRLNRQAILVAVTELQ
jgi:hypothetical protein